MWEQWHVIHGIVFKDNIGFGYSCLSLVIPVGCGLMICMLWRWKQLKVSLLLAGCPCVVLSSLLD